MIRCPNCDAYFSLYYDDINADGEPAYCPFCGRDFEYEDEDYGED